MSRQNKSEAVAWDILEQNKDKSAIYYYFSLFCPLLVAKVTNMWAFIVKI